MNLEHIPLLILALLLISAGGAEVQTAEIVMAGDHELTEHRGALIVADATVTVPAEANVSGPIYVIGGELHLDGRVTSDVTQLSGSVVLAESGAIAGQLQHYAGTESIDPGAEIGERTTMAVTPAEPDPVAAYLPTALAALVLSLVGIGLTRRRPSLLHNVGSAAREHPLVSLTVGALVFVTFLSVFVFMAFTLILIPVALLGLVVGALTVAYGVVAVGYVFGRGLGLERTDWATAAGIVIVIVLLQFVGILPVVGDLLVIGLLLTGFGAVLLTYYGLARFEPVRLPE